MRRFTVLTIALGSAVSFLLGAVLSGGPAMRRGFVIREINRQPGRSVADFQRLVSAARTGDALAFYGSDPSVGQRGFVLATVDTR